MIKRIAAALIALAIAGCSAPQTIHETTTVTADPTTVSATVTETVTETPVLETPSMTAADAAACRLITPALEQSGLRTLADQATAGTDPVWGETALATDRFVNALSVAPSGASNSITAPLLTLLTQLQTLQDNFSKPTDDIDNDAVYAANHGFASSVNALIAACAD